jgi:hypothetical protein
MGPHASPMCAPIRPFRFVPDSGSKAGRSALVCLLLFHSSAVAAQTQAAANPGGLKVTVLEGEGAINNIRDLRAKEPVVQVTDESDAPVKDATVTFLLPDTGASGTFGDSGATLTIQTDELGHATGRGLRPNNVVGQFEIRVVASTGTLSARTTITQTNAAPAVAKAGSSKTLLWVLILAGAAGGGAAAALGGKGSSGGGSSPTPGPSPTTITPGVPVFGAPH